MQKIDCSTIYKKAITQWGETTQLMQAMEEASELAVALSHLIRKRYNAVNEVTEEIADVEIMLAQIKYMFGSDFEIEIDNVKSEKLKRLEERLDS